MLQLGFLYWLIGMRSKPTYQITYVIITGSTHICENVFKGYGVVTSGYFKLNLHFPYGIYALVYLVFQDQYEGEVYRLGYLSTPPPMYITSSVFCHPHYKGPVGIKNA